MVSVEVVSSDSAAGFLNRRGVAVLDFWAAWCRPCAQFSPVFSHVSDQMSGVSFGSVNTDAEQDLARQFMVASLPTVVVLIDGAPVFRKAGVMTGRELRSLVEKFVALEESRSR